MRVLTIKQPWVGAIFTMGKNVENRTWSTSYRGPLIIQASASPARTPDAREVGWGHGEAWAQGAIVGIVQLVDCVRNARGPWADKDAWHWMLQSPYVLNKPIPCKGRLGLWTLDDATARAIKRQVKRDVELLL